MLKPKQYSEEFWYSDRWYPEENAKGTPLVLRFNLIQNVTVL